MQVRFENIPLKEINRCVMIPEVVISSSVVISLSSLMIKDHVSELDEQKDKQTLKEDF